MVKPTPLPGKSATRIFRSTPVSLSWTRSGGAEPVIIAEALANTGSFDWTTPLDMTDGGTIFLTATDKAGNQATTSVGNIVIDAVPPSRNIVGPAIIANQAIPVAIRSTDAGPSGLDKVQLFFSQDAGKTWNPGPVIDQAPFDVINWTAPTDGNYELALVATDEAGNANPMPKGAGSTQFSTLVDTISPGISLGSPIGIVDPTLASNAALRRIFAGGDQVEVRFSINEVNVRADGVSVWFQSQQGANWEPLGQNLSPNETFSFVIPNDIDSTSCRIRVVCTDVAGNTGEITAGETFTIDNTVESQSQATIDW